MVVVVVHETTSDFAQVPGITESSNNVQHPLPHESAADRSRQDEASSIFSLDRVSALNSLHCFDMDGWTTDGSWPQKNLPQ